MKLKIWIHKASGCTALTQTALADKIGISRGSIYLFTKAKEIIPYTVDLDVKFVVDTGEIQFDIRESK